MALILAAFVCGCEGNKKNDDDHDVPDGMGSLIVDNNSGDKITIYIDGARQTEVGSYADKAFDLQPGIHRVVLDQRHGPRTYRDDVDILEGKRTVLDIAASAYDNEYDVAVFFD